MILGYDHLCETFSNAERHHSDLMEPYSTLLSEATDDADRTAIMRRGLFETFRRRYPMEDRLWAPR